MEYVVGNVCTLPNEQCIRCLLVYGVWSSLARPVIPGQLYGWTIALLSAISTEMH